MLLLLIYAPQFIYLNIFPIVVMASFIYMYVDTNIFSVAIGSGFQPTLAR